MQKVKNRNIFLFILLNTITFGIYGVVALSIMSKEINEACEGDGKNTMLYIWASLLGLITFGIFDLIWFYKAMERLKDNGYRYDIEVKHSGGEFLLWFLLGSFIAVGPLVAICYFVADVNQFSDYVGVIPARRYSSNPIERLEIKKEPLSWGIESEEPPVNGDDNSDNGTVYRKDTGNISWTSGDYCGYSFPVNPGKEIIIGRDPAVANIIIDQRFTTVSKKHCGIKFDPNTQLYSLIDYSSNGTFVNGGTRIISNQLLQFQAGTKVSIGNGENSFVLD